MPTVQLNQVKSLEQEQADKPRFAQVKNQTARRIGLTAKKIAAEQRNPLLIPAFGSVEIKIEMLKDFEIEEWERSRLVQVDYELTPREKSQKFWEDFFIVFSQFMLSLLTFGAILLILLGFLQIF